MNSRRPYAISDANGSKGAESTKVPFLMVFGEQHPGPDTLHQDSCTTHEFRYGTAAMLQIERDNVTISDCSTTGTPLGTDQASTKHCHSQEELSTTQQKPVALSFLSLPAELRNQIYEDVFQGWVIAIRPSSKRQDSLDTGIWPVNTDPYQILGRHSLPLTDKSSNKLSLLYTCRQIHAETKLLPYGLNTLLCGDNAFPRAWLDDLHTQLSQIRCLQLCSYMPANIILSRVWLKILPWFNDLKKVEVHWQMRVPPWGSEEDHLSTATADEVDMRKKIIRATSAACDISFHRAVVWE